MILTCPNCSCQFKVGLAVFGREGRSVKCSACKETWFQEPSLEDVSEEIAEEETPKSVLDPVEPEAGEEPEPEITEEEFVEQSQERVEEFESKQGQKLAYYIAGGLFAFILLILLLMGSSMLKKHPTSQSFYGLFGMRLELPDTLSIMFEGVKAERDGTEIIASGRIVNLSRKKWDLPMIEVVVFRPVVDAEGKQNEEVIAQWIEKPPEPAVDAEKEIPFSFSRHVSFGTKMHSSVPHEEKSDDAHGASDHKDEYMMRVHFVVRPQEDDEGHHKDEAEPHEDEEVENAKHADAHDGDGLHDAKEEHGTGH